MRGCSHLAGQFAGQMYVLGHDIQRPARGKLAAEHRPWDVIEGTAGPSADRDDPRQNAEVDACLGADEEPFQRGHEVRIAQVLSHQLGDTAAACLSYIENVTPYALQQRPV